MFLIYLLYILIFNFSKTTCLQSVDQMDSIYPSLTTLETTTDHKKNIKRTLRNAYEPFLRNIQTDALVNIKHPFFIPLKRVKSFTTIMHMPYPMITRNMTTDQATAAVATAISPRTTTYPTEMVYLPRTVSYTMHNNPYFELSLISTKKNPIVKSSLKHDSEKHKINKCNDPKILPKTMTIRRKKTSKAIVNKVIQDELNSQRKLPDYIVSDDADSVKSYIVDLDYSTKSYIRNIHTYQNYEAMFQIKRRNLTTNEDSWWLNSFKIYRPTKSIEDFLPKFKHRQLTDTNNYKTSAKPLGLTFFKLPRENIPFRSQNVEKSPDITGSLIQYSSSERNTLPIFKQERTTETSVTSAAPVIYKAIDKVEYDDSETESFDELETQSIKIPSRTRSLTRTWTLHSFWVSTITLKKLFALTTTASYGDLELKSSITPKNTFDSIVTPNKLLNLFTSEPVAPNTYYLKSSATPKTVFVFDSIAPNKLFFWKSQVTPNIFKSVSTTKAILLHVSTRSLLGKYSRTTPMTTSTSETPIKQRKKSRNKKKSRKRKKNKTNELHTPTQPDINEIVRRFNKKKPTITAIPPHMARDWAEWEYRRGRTGFPAIYVDLFNNFYDSNYVTK